MEPAKRNRPIKETRPLRPISPARTITAPYAADHPPPMPERIRALLGKRAADLTRAELLDIAADAANRDAWGVCGDHDHVGAICDLAGTLEAELAETSAQLEAERKDHAGTREVLESVLGVAFVTVEASVPEPDAHPSGALEALLTTGPDEPGPHDAITVDSALDDDEARVATDEEMGRG